MSNTVSYKFSGHQTFAFRFGWLEKGVKGIETLPDLFYRDDALVHLGVGKNMVESIRHWCTVAQLIEPVPSADRHGSRTHIPKEFARRLFLENAWDPFLEDDASLWLIHWLLATNPAIVTSLQLLFAHYNHLEFSRRELTNYVRDFVEKQQLKVSDSVIARDIDCLIRTYIAGSGSKNKAAVEDSFSCPLINLNLLQLSPDGEYYRFSIGPKPSLPAPIFAFALSAHFERGGSRVETLSIQECLYGAGSPGQVFKLDENSLIEYVEELEDQTRGGLLLDETAGLKQIYRTRRFDPFAVLDSYYGRSSEK